MVSRVLPQELRTKKTNSLPSDLKDIAEQLIGEKFGFEEEVVERKSHDPFPRVGFGFDEFEPSSRDSGGRDRDVSDIRVNHAPWNMHARIAEIEITYPSWDNLLNALRKMDMQNIRPREPKTFAMHPEFYRFFMRTDDARMYFKQSMGARPRPGERQLVGHIVGCDVIVTPQVRHCILRAEF